MTKTCSKCNILKPLSKFHKHSKNPDGYHYDCKDCRKLYYNTHKKEITEYLNCNKKHTAKQKQIYRKSHKKEYLKATKRYNINHPEMNRKRCRRRRARKLEVKENYTTDDEQYTHKIFKNKCACCGSTEKLQIDHHYPLSKGYALTRQNAVLLCKSCNCSKHDNLPEDFYSCEKLKLIEEKLKCKSI